jgi:hypothetical protein
MRLDLVKKPEGEWASFNEACVPPKGDGTTKEFKTPIPASEARSVLVMRGFFMMAPDNRLTVTNQKTGSIERDDPDGYKLETRGEGELWVVFDRAPAFEEPVSVSGLGRKVGDAFKILPASTFLQQKIREKQPAIFRGAVKDRENITQQDLQEGARVNFEFFVEDWLGISDGQSAPLPCTPENKKAFLEQKDATFFGLFVSNRAGAIRTERMNSFQKDSSD